MEENEKCEENNPSLASIRQMVPKIPFLSEKSEHNGRRHFAGVSFVPFVSGGICVEIFIVRQASLLPFCQTFGQIFRSNME